MVAVAARRTSLTMPMDLAVVMVAASAVPSLAAEVVAGAVASRCRAGRSSPGLELSMSARAATVEEG